MSCATEAWSALVVSVPRHKLARLASAYSALIKVEQAARAHSHCQMGRADREQLLMV
jgi:hypothetical protein